MTNIRDGSALPSSSVPATAGENQPVRDGDGLKIVYSGRGMTMWNTREEAEASWRAPSLMDLVQRSETVWWRSMKVVPVDCPPDVSLQAVLKKDL